MDKNMDILNKSRLQYLNPRLLNINTLFNNNYINTKSNYKPQQQNQQFLNSDVVFINKIFNNTTNTNTGTGNTGDSNITTNALLSPQPLQNIENIQNENKYNIVKYLGEGIQGSLYLANDKMNNRFICKKIMLDNAASNFSNTNNTEQIKQIQFELNLLKYLSQSKITREHINPCLESKIIDNNVFTIFPVFDGYSLNHLTTYLQKLNHDAYYKIVFHLIKTILHGMAKIHQSKIAHQNINNNSILVSTYSNPKQINIKFTDFGLGCGNGNTFINSCKKNNYTPINISEDVIDKLSTTDYLNITQKYDLFCLGIIFIKLLLFFESFSGIDNMDQMNQMNGKNSKNANQNNFTNNKNFPGFTTNFNQQILDLINNKYLSKLKSKKDLKNIFMFLNINTEAKRDLLEYLKMLLKYVFCKTSDRKTCQYILDKIIIYEKYKNDVF